MLTLTETRQFLDVAQAFNIHGFLNQTAYYYFKTTAHSDSGLTAGYSGFHDDSLKARWTSCSTFSGWLWCISSIRPTIIHKLFIIYVYIYIFCLYISIIIDIHLDPPSIQNMQISSSFHITSLPSRFTRRATSWLACGISWPLDGWTLSLVWY